MKIEIFKDRRKEWRWHLHARNGRVIAVSGEGYKRKGAALKIISKLFPTVKTFIE